jgi:hypothetical protein
MVGPYSTCESDGTDVSQLMFAVLRVVMTVVPLIQGGDLAAGANNTSTQ